MEDGDLMIRPLPLSIIAKEKGEFDRTALPQRIGREPHPKEAEWKGLRLFVVSLAPAIEAKAQRERPRQFD
jgi:hypothetical protein